MNRPVLKGDALFFELGVRAADHGELGLGVDDVGNGVVAHVAGLAGDDLGDGDTFVLGLVREHRAAHEVADGVDAFDIGPEVLVDDHPACFVERDAGSFEACASGDRAAADRDEHGGRRCFLPFRPWRSRS